MRVHAPQRRKPRGWYPDKARSAALVRTARRGRYCNLSGTALAIRLSQFDYQETRQKEATSGTRRGYPWLTIETVFVPCAAGDVGGADGQEFAVVARFRAAIGRPQR